MFIKMFFRTYTRKKELFVTRFWRREYSHAIDDDTCVVSLSRLKQSFKRNNLSVVYGHTCIITDCPLCCEKKKESKVYVNKVTGYFVCSDCKCTGSWSVLEKFLAKAKVGSVSKELESLKENLKKQQDFTDKWEDLKKICKSVSEMSADEYNYLLQKHSLPNISQKDMSVLDCIYESDSYTLHFPIKAFGNFVVGYKSYSLLSNAETTVPTTNVGGCITYKSVNAKTGSHAVIVATIPDLLVLMANVKKCTVICLPYNMQSLPQELLPTLESYKKLTLWFGNDTVSWHVIRNFAKKLGEKRCYFVRPKDLQPQPNLAAKMGLDILTILRNVDPIWHENIITFQHLREDVLNDLQNIEKVQGIKWKRYPTLNKILRGHRRGEFTVLTGPTGCGKTTFMCEYSLDLAMQGVNTLWGSFEIRNVRLVRTMLQQMAGVSLSQNVNKFDMYADEFEKLPLYFMNFHGQQSIKIVMDAIEHATYVYDIAHVVIDNVQFMMGMSDQAEHMDRFWKQDHIIANFRNFATKYNCHVTLVIHPRKEKDNEELTTSSIFGSAKASQEADNVLIIQDKRLSTIRGKKFLQIAKNRYSGDLGIMMLDFDKNSLSYAQKKCKKKKPAEESQI